MAGGKGARGCVHLEGCVARGVRGLVRVCTGRKSGQRREVRTVRVGKENSTSYPSNRVTTSKYTAWNFVPKNLLEQFRRIANFYFLCIGLISALVEGPMGPLTTLLPIMLIVIVTALKQGYEDCVRHKADRDVNNAPVWVLRKAAIEKIPSKRIRVGDVIRVKEGEDVPCDMVLLISSREGSKCYVTTTSLDGEMTVKTLYCPKSLKRSIEEEHLRFLDATIECEEPTPDLYKFNGRIEFGRTTSAMLRRSSLRRQTSQPEREGDAPRGELLRRTLESLPEVTKKTSTLPRATPRRHKKSYSNWGSERDSAFVERARASLRKMAENVLVDSLTTENLLLKGSTLRNTEYVYGCAVYTGPETKMALNGRQTRNKFSMAEKSINRFLTFQLGLLLVESVASTALNATLGARSGLSGFSRTYAAGEGSPRGTLLSTLRDFLLFVTAYNYLVPVSLYVTLEMTKFLGSRLFKWDECLRDEGSGHPAECNTSDLNEELGQVEYLFTDKTGTLTENSLRFHSCSIRGEAFVERCGKLYREGEDSPAVVDFCDESESVQMFLLALTLCNTVQVIVENGGDAFGYSATSPDEKAFVEAMQRMDIVFVSDDDFVVLSVCGRNKIFRKLEVLEFSSARKRMSVIVRDEEDRIRLYCKGAESAVIPKIVEGPAEETLAHVSAFARKGLRTLVVGYRTLSEEEYSRVEVKLRKARETLSSDREEILRKTYEEVECGLTLLGATGVEDKLQDGVRDAIDSLRSAGIKVWMLTGDKVETAVQISVSCGHFTHDTHELRLTGLLTADECDAVVRHLRSTVADNPERRHGLVVDGTSLQAALSRPCEPFRELCTACDAVICCRLSPMQKSSVVNLVKSGRDAPVVAAIGDGANDVPMIKEAHVGIGIMGKEGRQAVLCSDFAFARFRFLERALFVHGHWYYVRSANLIQYFLYKNIVFIMPQFYYFFYSGYSVQQLYESAFYICYNTIFTSLPPLIYGVFEQDVPGEKLLSSPRLYRVNRRNALMNWNYFLQWLVLGVWHSLVIFFTPTLLQDLDSNATSQGCIHNYGTTIFLNVVLVVNLKLLLHSRFWSAPLVAAAFMSVFVPFIFTLTLSSIFMPNVNDVFHWTFNRLVKTPNFWLGCLFTCVTALVPDVIVYVYLGERLSAFEGGCRSGRRGEDDSCTVETTI